MDQRGRFSHCHPTQHEGEERLESWKEIAGYLDRDVRTIARWEKHEGLPVHRHLHGKSASVYALKRELDSWRLKRTEENGRRRAWRGAALVLALGAVAAAVFTAGWLTSSRKGATRLFSKPLTGLAGTELHPAFSPDGQYVAFVWNGEGADNFDIYVRMVAEGRPLRLTSDPANDYSPTWSPDGVSVAFLRQMGPTRAAAMDVPALGGTERKVKEISGGLWDWSRPGPFLAWSPDSRSLIVTGWKEPEKVDQLMQVALATGESRALVPLPARSMGDSAPAFSPDGKTLAFSRRISWGMSELLLTDVSKDGATMGALRRLETGSTWNTSPAWTPDSHSLVFSCGTMDSPYLATIDVTGSDPARRLADVGDYGWFPSITRGAGGHMRLVYVWRFESVNLWKCTPGQRNAGRSLVSSPHRSFEPAFSPDGKRIAFISDRTGFGEIWVADADGRNVTQWTNMRRPSLGSPRWSLDSRTLAFTAPGDRGSSIYLSEAPGALPRLVRGSERCGYLAWSPDGRAIYYSSDRGGSTQIWKIAAEGGDPIQITSKGGRVPGVAPGGSHLFYLRSPAPGQNDLYRMPLSGGEEEKVLEFIDAYALAQTGVAFKYYRPGSNPVGPFLQFFSFGTRSSDRLPDATKPLRYGVAVSPDGSSVLYAQADYQVSELRVVDDFR